VLPFGYLAMCDGVIFALLWCYNDADEN